MKKAQSYALYLLAFVSLRANAALTNDVMAWLGEELPRAQSYLEANISTAKFPKGFVIAAPWEVKGIQNYRYHWTRDAALVMNTFATSYVNAKDAKAKEQAFIRLRDYANFSKQNQDAPETGDALKVGLGEVKFNPDGSRFTDWMRPQNDGPALRAITLIRFARSLLHEGKKNLVLHLYRGEKVSDAEWKAPSLIKADLDFVADHLNDVSYDPWEEVVGHHFYVRMAQRKALRDGAELAHELGDESAKKYLARAQELEKALLTHWIASGKSTPQGFVSSGQIWDTFDRTAGLQYKISGLDVSAVLAALHAHNELDEKDRFFSASDARVLATAHQLAKVFAATFPVAQLSPKSEAYGAPIGRYPYDKYNGLDGKHDANPWYLATASFAELYYRCAREWRDDGKIVVGEDLEFLKTLGPNRPKPNEVITAKDKRFEMMISSLVAVGDSYLRLVKLRAAPGGHLNEQFSRIDGSPQGAVDLSWSYASILTAGASRP